jgi:hypothetical protein
MRKKKMTQEELTVDSLGEMMWEEWKRTQPLKPGAAFSKWNARRKNTTIGVGIRTIAAMVWPLMNETRKEAERWKNLYRDSQNNWATERNKQHDMGKVLEERTKERDTVTDQFHKLLKEKQTFIDQQFDVKRLAKELEVTNDALVESRKNTDRCTVKLCQLIDILDRWTDPV